MNCINLYSRLIQRVTAIMFLHAAYFLGIGVVSVLGRMFGTRFLDEIPTKTNWKKPTGSEEMERMY